MLILENFLGNAHDERIFLVLVNLLAKISISLCF